MTIKELFCLWIGVGCLIKSPLADERGGEFFVVVVVRVHRVSSCPDYNAMPFLCLDDIKLKLLAVFLQDAVAALPKSGLLQKLGGFIVIIEESDVWIICPALRINGIVCQYMLYH